MKAIEEEKKLAEEKGEVEDGVPYITVKVDGGWCRRTYGHGFGAKSGVVSHSHVTLLVLECRECKFCSTLLAHAGRSVNFKLLFPPFHRLLSLAPEPESHSTWGWTTNTASSAPALRN